MSYDPYAAADAEQSDFMTRNPSTTGAAPWLTWKTPLAIGTGIGAGVESVGGIAQAAILAQAEQMQSVDKTMPDASTYIADNRRRLNAEAEARANVSPFVYGKAGDIVHGTAKFITEAVPAGAVAGPVAGAMVAGGAEGLDAFRRALYAGQDEQTAQLMGAIGGVGGFGGALLPLSGKTVGESVLRGFLLMPEVNAVQRGVTGQVLENAGYPEMAKQYEALDGTAILTDAIMGAAFGGIGHAAHVRAGPMADRIPTLVDAALADAKARAVEGAGPGIPADAETRNMHVAAMVKAESDLLAGRPVDVSAQMDPARATFVPDPHEAEYQSAVRAAIEAEYGPTLAEADRMRAESEATPLESTPIASSVVRFGGKEFDAPTHIAAIKQAMAEGLVPKDENGRVKLGPNDTINLYRLKDGRLISRDEAWQMFNAKLTEQMPPLTGAVPVEAMRGEIGWAERGGQIIREPLPGEQATDIGAGQQGPVVGRSKWVPKSEFWPNRPDKSLSEKGAHAALDKVASGERLTAKEQRFVDYARQTLGERGAEVEAARAESEAERAAIQGEQDRTFIDPDLVAAGHMKLSPDERIAMERWVEHSAELEAQREEIDRLAAEHSAAVPRGHEAPRAGGPEARAGSDQAGGEGAGREAGGQGNAAAEGQDPLAPIRAVLAERPDLHVFDENGQAVPLRDMLARADADKATAEEQARLTQIAVDCALRSAA